MSSKKMQRKKNKPNPLKVNNLVKFKRRYFNCLKNVSEYVKTAFTAAKALNYFNSCSVSNRFLDALIAPRSLNIPRIINHKEININQTDNVRKNLMDCCRDIDVNGTKLNCFIETETEIKNNKARYYATQIWNWRRTMRIYTYSDTVRYVKKYISKAIDAMTPKDIEIVQCLLQETIYIYCDVITLFNNLGHTKYIPIFYKLLHQWFLIMPLLEEFNKFISWETLIKIKTYLLDPDQLYSILLNVFYKTEG
ncbi:uncharacterized protein [Onthophagus taurus]|uniref:uncharacterized protein n=1 Tax=Onthophagus taurus TaxID=166361 RepID=UPI0039BEC350